MTLSELYLNDVDAVLPFHTRDSGHDDVGNEV